MKKTQKDIFLLSGEGDKYFERNSSNYLADSVEAIPTYLEFFSKYIRKNNKVLEVGCSTGINLQRLVNLTGCIGHGVDPSQEAIDEGKNSFPDLYLKVGTADELSYENEVFDFVLFGFCLYLVDRTMLAKVIAEADRVLCDESYLGITDFDSKYPVSRPYAHAEGVFSYKMDYSGLFTVYPHYSLAEKISYSHMSDSFNETPDERILSTVIFKDHNKAYTLLTE